MAGLEHPRSNLVSKYAMLHFWSAVNYMDSVETVHFAEFKETSLKLVGHLCLNLLALRF